jgi:hypothetical protein
MTRGSDASEMTTYGKDNQIGASAFVPAYDPVPALSLLIGSTFPFRSAYGKRTYYVYWFILQRLKRIDNKVIAFIGLINPS